MSSVLEEQRSILTALFDATSGPAWSNTGGWNTDASLEDWLGVSVEKDHVVKLRLFWNRLEGSIPVELGRLGLLTHLDLQRNKLTGSIPRELASLENLTVLNLGNNQLSGSIPPELGRLHNLTLLDIYHNQLTGSIPPELGSLPNLLELQLCVNKLTGNIPSELGKLAELRELRLGRNNLEGNIPPQLGQLWNLRELWLSGNNLEGSIPRELGSLEKLEVLVLSDNKLTGPIPAALIGRLGIKIRVYFFRYNSLSLPEDINTQTHLTMLDLSDQGLVGSIPPELGGLQNLCFLNLYNNKLTEISHDAAIALGKLRWIEILLSRNAWRSPSADVVDQGLDAVKRYWIDLEQGQDRWWKLKVMLVGKSGAGKTSLAGSLEAGKSELVGKQGDDSTTVGNGKKDETVGIETRNIKLREGETKPLELVIWDFAGQQDYYAYHQLFLTEGALYVLTVNLVTFVSTGSEAGERDLLVVEWLDTLQAYVPGSLVVVVGTHKDEVEGEDEERVERAREKLEDLVNNTVEAHKTCGVDPLNVQGTCLTVDLGSDEDVQRIRKFITKLALEGCTHETPSELFPNIGKVVPKPWMEVHGAIAESRKTQPCLRPQELEDLWSLRLSKWQRRNPFASSSNKRTFDLAVTLAHAAGEVLLCEGYLHVDPTWLMALVKPLASHKLTEETVKREPWHDMLLGMTKNKDGTNKRMELPSFDILHEEESNFLDKATTSSDYLFCLWQLWVSEGHKVGAASCEEGEPVKKLFQRLKEDTKFFKGMLKTLAQYGVILPVTGLKDEEGRKDVYVAPTRLRLGGGGNTGVRKVVTTFLKAKSEECTRGHFEACNAHFPSGTLPFLLAWFLGKRNEEPNKKVVVQINGCAKYAAALRVNDVDVLVMAEGGDLLLYVKSDTRSCRQVGGMVRNWIREMLGERFKGLAFFCAKDIMESIASRRQPLAAELRLLGDEYAKDDAAQFDVFLSHAGPDKWGLVYNLWVALWDSGITAFLDRENLQLGRQAPNYMVNAAKKAKIGLVVLSPQFLCREWCLKETEIFMERLENKKKGVEEEKDFLVVPLFYKLTPGDCYNGTEGLLKAHDEIGKQWGAWGKEDGPEKRWPETWQDLLPELSKQTGEEYQRQQFEADYVEKVRERDQSIVR